MKRIAIFALALCAVFAPDLALASGGISEFVTGPQKVMETLTGPLGRIISIIAMGVTGTMFIYNRDDMSGGLKILLSVVFGISFIAFASPIVDGLFSFSGARV
jgi:type IV secretion system protein VirB2